MSYHKKKRRRRRNVEPKRNEKEHIYKLTITIAYVEMMMMTTPAVTEYV